jgi:hypothetical protein
VHVASGGEVQWEGRGPKESALYCSDCECQRVIAADCYLFAAGAGMLAAGALAAGGLM